MNGPEDPKAVWNDPAKQEIKMALMNDAIHALQQECGIIGKDADNPFHKSKYASLEHIWTRLKPLLDKHGLTVIQLPLVNDKGAGVETLIVHKEGGVLSSRLPLPVPEKGLGAQGVGSCISYARRYALTSMLGVVVGDEDDDAEGMRTESEKPRQAKQEPRRREQAPTPPPAPKSASNVAPGANAAVPATPGAKESDAMAPLTGTQRKMVALAKVRRLEGWSDPDKESLLVDWVSKVVGRKVDQRYSLNGIPELEKLEAEVVKLEALYSGKTAELMRSEKKE